MRRAPAWAAKLRRYAVTGGLAAVVDLGAFAVLAAWGAAVPIAAVLSFLIANVANYLLSARFAFASRPSWRTYPLFLAAAGIGLCVNVAVTTIAASGMGVPLIAAKIAGIGVAFAVNFTLAYVVVFTRQ
ncbi:putative flippase GtrA [Palleronia aestuarii]|uniref:Putative flippase GtrA n=1 Tax=Palleronia aestuarii TaxID=568105 RepID=A0A2W7NH46_9RHOB|nr:GtrA family protein [Palleronia aestuarii]PZX18783.1 putative flippase GtrA [Palleronia aestuarii]